MKKIITTLLCCFALILSSNACLNQYYTIDKYGETHKTDAVNLRLPFFSINFDNQEIVVSLKTLEAVLKSEHTYMSLSDYAVGLLKLGKRKEALEILKVLSAAYPNEYRIASNLGTAYELNGSPDSALKYIRRGMQLNPADHEGSEWIHERILLTKLKLKTDPAWLNTHTVLELTAIQLMDETVMKQLIIQLQERFPFTPKGDPVMASLFIDLGTLYANTVSLESANACFQCAKDYFGDSVVAVVKIAEMKQLIAKYEEVEPTSSSGRKNRVLRGEVNYLHYLADNDPNVYEINWSKIITDPKVLLGMVNLDLNPKEAREKALKNQTGNLKLANDSADAKLLAVHDLSTKIHGTDMHGIVLLIPVIAIVFLVGLCFTGEYASIIRNNLKVLCEFRVLYGKHHFARKKGPSLIAANYAEVSYYAEQSCNQVVNRPSQSESL